MARVETGFYQTNPLRSVSSYAAELDEADLRKQHMAQNALALQTGQFGIQDRQRAIAEQAALRNALAMGIDPNTPEGRVKLLSAAPNAAPGIIKSLGDAGHVAAQTDEAKAKTAGMTQDQSIKAHGQHLQELQGVEGPEATMDWLRSGVANKTLDLAKAGQAAMQLQQNPGSWQELKARMLSTGIQIQEKAKIDAENARAALQSQTELAKSRASTGVILSPTGGPSTVDPAVINAKLAVAKAGATRVQTNVNSYTPASEEAQKDFMKGIRTRYDQLQSAPVLLKNIEEAKKLVDTAKPFMGPGGNNLLEAAKFLNNRLNLGINTEGVKSAEELRSRLFVQVMDNLKKMDAQPSEYQQKVMQDAFGTLGTDPSAVGKILDAFGDQVRGKVEIHNAEVADSVGKGVKYPYNPSIKLPAPTPPVPATPKSNPASKPGGWKYIGPAP